MEESELEYITVLDHSDGRVYQYENLEHLTGGWNGDEKLDSENIEWYLTEVQEHNLKNCEWMVHDDRRVIVQTPHGEIKQLQRNYDICGDDV